MVPQHKSVMYQFVGYQETGVFMGENTFLHSCVTADSADDSITWCSTDFSFQQVRVTPGFESAQQTHHSQCLNPLLLSEDSVKRFER